MSKRDRQHDEKECGSKVPGGKRPPPDAGETLVHAQSHGAAESQSAGGDVQQPSTSGAIDDFWVLARGAENYKALRQVKSNMSSMVTNKVFLARWQRCWRGTEVVTWKNGRGSKSKGRGGGYRVVSVHTTSTHVNMCQRYQYSWLLYLTQSAQEL